MPGSVNFGGACPPIGKLSRALEKFRAVHSSEQHALFCALDLMTVGKGSTVNAVPPASSPPT